GFGTLDANSLDVVVSALENLQASGKTIGLISHVPALRERIHHQIIVEPKGDGFSELRVA
ncbi:MAG: nuclease SbcCD subunit C, partial [Bacteroidota bacterium]